MSYLIWNLVVTCLDDMLEESVVYQDILRKGRKQGRQEGRQEGELQTLRTTIEETLKLRFGALPEEVRESVNHLNDLNQLRQLQREAVLCSQLERFTEQLSIAE